MHVYDVCMSMTYNKNVYKTMKRALYDILKICYMLMIMLCLSKYECFLP